MSLDAQRTLVHLTEALAATGAAEDKLRMAARALQDLPGTIAAGIVAFEPSSGKVRMNIFVQEVDAGEVARIYRSYDHYVPGFFKAGLGRKLFADTVKVYEPAEVLGADTWRTCEFHQAHLRPFGLENFIMLTSPERDTVWAVMLTQPRGIRFCPKRVKLLQALAPHLGRIFACLEHSPPQIDALEEIAAHEQDPVLIVRLGDGNQLALVLATTGGAENILRLKVAGASRDQALGEILRLCHDALQAGSSPAVWTAQDGRRYIVETTPTKKKQIVLVRLRSLVASVAGRSADARAALACGLSAREVEVCALVARGFTNRQIGLALGITPNTARTHVNNMCHALGVSGRIEAINRVRSEGLVQTGRPERRAQASQARAARSGHDDPHRH